MYISIYSTERKQLLTIFARPGPALSTGPAPWAWRSHCPALQAACQEPRLACASPRPQSGFSSWLFNLPLCCRCCQDHHRLPVVRRPASASASFFTPASLNLVSVCCPAFLMLPPDAPNPTPAPCTFSHLLSSSVLDIPPPCSCFTALRASDVLASTKNCCRHFGILSVTYNLPGPPTVFE